MKFLIFLPFSRMLRYEILVSNKDGEPFFQVIEEGKISISSYGYGYDLSVSIFLM